MPRLHWAMAYSRSADRCHQCTVLLNPGNAPAAVEHDPHLVLGGGVSGFGLDAVPAIVGAVVVMFGLRVMVMAAKRQCRGGGTGHHSAPDTINAVSQSFNAMRFSQPIRWRRGKDLNPRKACTFNGFQDRRNRPLCHPSAGQFGVCSSRAGRSQRLSWLSEWPSLGVRGIQAAQA